MFTMDVKQQHNNNNSRWTWSVLCKNYDSGFHFLVISHILIKAAIGKSGFPGIPMLLAYTLYRARFYILSFIATGPMVLEKKIF